MCRRLEQRGARRASARAFAWRLHHENPRKIERRRGYHRLRPARRRSLRRASLRNPARHRARHSAPRRHLRQRLRQQGQSGRRKSARHRSSHPAQGERKEQASLLRAHPLQSPRTHRAGRRTAQALQARRAPPRKDRTKLQINRQLRRRPLLDQIRPHGLTVWTLSTDCQNPARFHWRCPEASRRLFARGTRTSGPGDSGTFCTANP